MKTQQTQNSTLRTRPLSNKTANVEYFLWITFILGPILLLAAPASAQFKILVKPMTLEFTPLAGRTVQEVLQLRNRDANTPRVIDLKLHELSQYEDGSWRLMEPGPTVEAADANLSSCFKWVQLGATTATLGPLRMVPVNIKLKTPPRVRGFYCAAITAAIRPRPQLATTGASLVVRFLVPVLVQIRGRPMRQNIALKDVGMQFRPQSVMQPATTMVAMRIANHGGTYSRLKASMVLQKQVGGRWRTVTDAEFKEVSIIPGVELNLKSDIQRSLPPGRYKVMGSLYVDGRRVKPLQKEIDFAGDPGIARIVFDAALELTPSELSILGVPGATRTAVMKVDNTTDDAVDIQVSLTMPQVLKGVAFGDLKGEDLICTNWLRVVPEKFKLRAGGRQNIRVISRMPSTQAVRASYYALLNLRATYPDGTSGGTTTAIVCVQNKNIPPEPYAQPMRLILAEAEPSTYIVSARFGNVGNIHFTPKCVASTSEGGPTSQILLTGKPGTMLPLEVRDFSGIMDFSRYKEGTYHLTVILEYAGSIATREIPIRVSLAGSQRMVEVIE